MAYKIEFGYEGREGTVVETFPDGLWGRVLSWLRFNHLEAFRAGQGGDIVSPTRTKV